MRALIDRSHPVAPIFNSPVQHQINDLRIHVQQMLRGSEQDQVWIEDEVNTHALVSKKTSSLHVVPRFFDVFEVIYMNSLPLPPCEAHRGQNIF